MAKVSAQHQNLFPGKGTGWATESKREQTFPFLCPVVQTEAVTAQPAQCLETGTAFLFPLSCAPTLDTL